MLPSGPFLYFYKRRHTFFPSMTVREYSFIILVQYLLSSPSSLPSRQSDSLPLPADPFLIPATTTTTASPPEGVGGGVGGSAGATCPEVCPQIFAPVCGSDGVTYSSVCQLQLASCLLGSDITVVAEGACGEWRERQVSRRGEESGGGVVAEQGTGWGGYQCVRAI